MRWVLGFVALLLAMLVVLTLSSRTAKRDIDAANRAIPSLQEQAAPVPFDEGAARGMRDRLLSLLDSSPLPEDELRQAAAHAAGWIAATSPGTNPYHAAVALRSAADELLAASADPGDPHRGRARRFLDEASQSLGSAPAPMPGGPTGAIRDQLQNLQDSQRERYREIEKQAP